jgi:diguanylate cyclase (GGDEF)-like protein
LLTANPVMQELNTAELAKLREDIDSVQGRFSHLLSVTIFVMLVLAAGIVLRVFPRLLWNLQNSESERNYVPQLLCGLFFLVVLLSGYVVEQRRNLKRTQKQLIRELVLRETAERLAVIDSLTELYNRRYITQAITREVTRADRQNYRLAFLMIDVNGFKQVNDSFGHMVGDHILREVALLLQRTFRMSDIISRYGGDEFLVLLVDVDDQKSARAVERLQREVDQWNRAEPIKGYKMSLSCGTATYQRGADPQAVLDAADQAMYEEKRRTPLSATQTS